MVICGVCCSLEVVLREKGRGKELKRLTNELASSINSNLVPYFCKIAASSEKTSCRETGKNGSTRAF